MKRFFLTFLLVLLLGEHGYAQSIEDSEILKLMKDNNVPNLSMVIIKNGKVTYKKNYPDLTVDKVFEAASLSKPVFAYGVLKMVDTGRLDLDRPLVQYLPHPDIKDPRIDLITARMVLSHSSGLPNGKPANRVMKIHFMPGEKFSYSGQGFVYLQKVVEHLAGESIEEYMQQNVLRPLGMTNSSYVWQDVYDKTKEMGYNSKGVKVAGIRPEKGVASYTLHTTAADYAKFIIAIIKGTGLKKSSIQAMLTPHIRAQESGPICIDKCSNVLSSDIAWGLGFGLQKTTNGTFFWHWGVNDGFRSYVAGLKNGKSIIIFTNSSNGLNIIPQIVEMNTSVKHTAFSWLGQ